MNILSFFNRLIPHGIVQNTAPGLTALLDGFIVPFIVDGQNALWVHDIGSSVAPISPSSTGRFDIFSTPAAATQATATTASAGAGNRNVLTSISATIDAVNGQALQNIVVRDGASGVGPILWSQNIGAVPVGQSKELHWPIPDGIVGSVATSLTVEFIAAPAAGNTNSIAGTGFISG